MDTAVSASSYDLTALYKYVYYSSYYCKLSWHSKAEMRMTRWMYHVKEMNRFSCNELRDRSGKMI